MGNPMKAHQDGRTAIGHDHFWRRALSRRQFRASAGSGQCTALAFLTVQPEQHNGLLTTQASSCTREP